MEDEGWSVEAGAAGAGRARPHGHNVAKNESPPRALADQVVTVTRQGEGYLVAYGGCEMKGSMSNPTLLVATGECDLEGLPEVAVPLPLALEWAEVHGHRTRGVHDGEAMFWELLEQFTTVDRGEGA